MVEDFPLLDRDVVVDGNRLILPFASHAEALAALNAARRMVHVGWATLDDGDIACVYDDEACARECAAGVPGSRVARVWAQVEAPAVRASTAPASRSDAVEMARRSWNAAVKAWSRDDVSDPMATMKLGEQLLYAATDLICAQEDEIDRTKDDTARLDFLDAANRRLNAHCGTNYRWRLIMNHNVNRLMIGHMEIDLNDAEGGKDALPSCRAAIEERRGQIARAGTAGEA